jgi:hypothetical protein
MNKRVASLYLIAVALLGGIACGQTLSGEPISGVTSTPDPGTTPLPSTIQRDAAIGIVRALRERVGRVDRVEAKLMTLEEYVKFAGPVRPRPGDPQASVMPASVGIIGDPAKRYVWVVAVAGEVWPNLRNPISWGQPLPGSPTPYPPYRWGIFLVEAVPGRMFAVGDAGIAEAWPSSFDKLPNHPPTAYVAPSATPRLTTVAARIQQPEATSEVMRLTAEVRRIDRIEAKLMTWHEYLASGDPGAYKPVAADDSAPVWIVAVAGEIVPQIRPWPHFQLGRLHDRRDGRQRYVPDRA